MHKHVAVVIGVGGMGLAIARRLGSGRRLIVADINPTTVDAAVDLLRGDGHDVAGQSVDVADPGSVQALAAAADALGPVTQVAHTAGLSPTQASTEHVLRVNLLGVALSINEFGRVVAPGGAGVVIASMAGHLVAGQLTTDQERALATAATADLLDLPFLDPHQIVHSGLAYSLAKRGVMLRVQAGAAAWGERGARINSISPGVISTPQGQHELARGSGDRMREMVARSAAGRLGTPDDIAAAAMFLLDPQSSLITGTDLLVDGGIVAASRSGGGE
jgi:NAD(P)-dependent dehydrogenase (short-subunit alcohol dehydrogenase family)